MLIIKKPSLINESLGFVEGNVDFGYALESTPDHLNVNLIKLTISVQPKSKNLKFNVDNLGKIKKAETIGHFSKVSHALSHLSQYLMNDIPQEGVQTINDFKILVESVNKTIRDSVSEIKEYYRKHNTIQNLNLD